MRLVTGSSWTRCLCSRLSEPGSSALLIFNLRPSLVGSRVAVCPLDRRWTACRAWHAAKLSGYVCAAVPGPRSPCRAVDGVPAAAVGLSVPLDGDSSQERRLPPRHSAQGLPAVAAEAVPRSRTGPFAAASCGWTCAVLPPFWQAVGVLVRGHHPQTLRPQTLCLSALSKVDVLSPGGPDLLLTASSFPSEVSR